MNSHQSIFMQHEDSPSALDDIFIHPGRQDWMIKPLETSSTTRFQDEDGAERSNCFSNPLSGIPFFDEPARICATPETSLQGESSLFTHLPRDEDSFPIIQDVAGGEKYDASFSIRSGHLDADELSENTNFSEYFSESGSHNKITDKFVSENLSEGNKEEKFEGEESKPNVMNGSLRKEVQKPPTTAGIKLEHLKAVFHLERPKAEKKLGLKRTTFSNLSRHYGISKWPFRTIRDATNRMEANRRLLESCNVSKERRRKLQRQQKLLDDVIELIYSDPRHSKDSNTLAVLLMIVGAKDG